MSKSLKVLIACEFTGTVRRAFDALGHDVWSCDVRPALDGSNKHIRGDVRHHLHDGWDLMMVAHPPCTRLCNSGVRWLSEPCGKLEADTYTDAERAAFEVMSRDDRLAFLWAKLDEGAALFSDLWNAPIPRIAIENPVMHGHAKARIRNYEELAQSVQPWMFGDNEKKRTCFWLKNLKPLVPWVTEEPANCVARVHKAKPGPERNRERSKFFPGMARAMAEQWGGDALADRSWLAA